MPPGERGYSALRGADCGKKGSDKDRILWCDKGNETVQPKILI